MTYQGAIDELKSLENNESMPDWFKPTLKKVRETMEMDRREKLDEIKEEIADEYANTHHIYPEYAGGLSHAYEIIDKHIDREDFPQAKDIEPTVKGFVDTMDILDRLCKESEE